MKVTEEIKADHQDLLKEAVELKLNARNLENLAYQMANAEKIHSAVELIMERVRENLETLTEEYGRVPTIEMFESRVNV